jgi:hypothetical protein
VELGSTATSYVTNIAERKKDWIERFAKPRDVSDPLRQSDAQESPDCHLQLLDKYLKVVPYILPTDKELHRPTLSHLDLHAGNIFRGKPNRQHHRLASILNSSTISNVQNPKVSQN